MSSDDINEIKYRLDNIENTLRLLVEKIDNLNKSCNRMDSHISFVEDTYEGLKYPLRVLKNKVENVFGKEKSITHEDES
jgi:archaellum component FlaC